MSKGCLLVALALGLSACAPAPQRSQAPEVEALTLEQLYLAERYGELVLLAASILEAEAGAEAEEPERAAEARFFRALAWLVQDPPGKHARALLELRQLEFEHPDLLWGRLAGLYVAAMTRVEVLQATLVELAIEQRDLQTRLEALEQSLAELLAERSKREADLAALNRERNQLVEQLEEARKQAVEAAARLRELEDELAALKQIDMQREP
ncbi:MAG: hypothetical protein R6X02_27270 [Enhygromyxa sp.]